MQFNNQELAQLYAVQKTIENELLNGQPHIAHSTVFNVGGPVTVTVPDGTTVFRGEGSEGNGTNKTKATTNLNGYAILFEFIKYLRKFKQHNVTHDEIRHIVQAAIDKGTSSEDAFRKQFPEQVDAFEQMREDWSSKMPLRTQTTPRRIGKENAANQPNVNFHKRKAA